MEVIKSYKDLIVWQKAVRLSASIYELTENFPTSEAFGLTGQIRRAAVSVPSNIAEGRSRGSRKDFTRFLLIAFGSCAELETQIEIAKQLKYVASSSVATILDELVQIKKMLSVMIVKLKANHLKAKS